jgi:hypothetical protein
MLVYLCIHKTFKNKIMITLTQQTSEQNTLTQNHLDMVTMNEVKKVNLVCQLERLEIEMQQPVKDWDKIAFLKTDIAKLKNYLKNN